jgi:MSHA biogenesis protein MshQ
VNGPTTSTDISLVLTPFIAAATTIRFEVVNTNGSNDFYAIDFVEVRAIAPQCFSEDFSASSLDPADWATNSVSGSFGQPRIINGRLRLTDNSIRVATAASLRRFFPGADNRVVVEFDYFGYNGSGADGIAVVLSDGSVTPVAGAFGGSLGYAQKAPPPASDCETSTGCPGFAGGWLGVGLDEFGNFSNPTEGRVGGPGSRRDAIALRGSGSGTTGYRYLAGTNTLSPGVDISGSTPGPNHRYRITIDNRSGVVTGATVSVERRTTPSGSFVSLVSPFDIFSANPGQAPVPENFRLSFTGSTGGSTNSMNWTTCGSAPPASTRSWRSTISASSTMARA